MQSFLILFDRGGGDVYAESHRNSLHMDSLNFRRLIKHNYKTHILVDDVIVLCVILC